MDGPSKLDKEPPIGATETKPIETNPLLKVGSKEEVSDDEDIHYEGLPQMFATVSHLPAQKQKLSLLATETDPPAKKRPLLEARLSLWSVVLPNRSARRQIY